MHFLSLLSFSIIILQVSAFGTLSKIGGASSANTAFTIDSSAFGTFSIPNSEYSLTVSKSLNCSSGIIAISYNGKEYFKSICNIPPVTTSFGEDKFGPGDGVFEPTISDVDKCDSGSLDKLLQQKDGSSITLSGTLGGPSADACKNIKWTLNFSIGNTSISPPELQFSASISMPDGNSGRVIINFESDSNEELYGFGEQFSFLNCKGRKLPIITQENGIGRGVQPLTGILNRFGKKVGGTDVDTYSSVPQFISSKMYAFYLRDFYSFSLFDSSQPDKISIRADQNDVQGTILFGKNYLELIEYYTGIYSGRMPLIPEWASEGIIMGLEGGTKEVTPIITEIKKRNISIAAIWVQDWAGIRHQKIAGATQDRIWWNWEADHLQYPNWPEFVANNTKDGIRTIVYVNAFLADVGSKLSGYTKNYFKEAEEKGYLIRNAKNETYIISSGPGFETGLTDLTNPDAVKWFQNVIRETVFKSGASGYMADFGEYLPMDSKLSTGISPYQYHNKYPEDWAKLNSELLDEAPGGSLIFHRSFTSRSPRYTSMLWNGDQIPTFDDLDGMRSTIFASLGAGFSGMGVSHSDIGGFTIIKALSLSIYSRTEELLCRWMELAAFTSLFRSHPGSVRSDLQIYSNERLMNQLSFTSRLFKSLHPYRRHYHMLANTKGYPYMRSMVMQYPTESKWFKDVTVEQFMLGDLVLVAAITDKSSESTHVKFPSNSSWFELWTGVIHNGGSEKDIAAPIGKPPIFISWPRSDNGMLDNLFSLI